MRQLLWLILIMINYAPAAPTQQELFLQGNKEYKDGNYEKALHYYEKITHKNASVWFNMAAVEIKRENPLFTLLYAHRAQKNAPYALYNRCEDLCKKAYAMLGNKLPTDTYTSLQQIMHSFIMPHSTRILQVVSFFIFSVFLMLSYYWLIRKRHILFVFSCCLLLGILVSLYAIMAYKETRYALISKMDTPFYTGPDTNFHQQGSLKIGTLVQQKKHHAHWVKIQCNNQAGWVQQDAVLLI